MSRFASRPEERQQQILQDMDSEATSDSTPDPGYVDDVAPGFEEFFDSTSSNDQFGRPDSGGGNSSHMPNSGGASPSNMPISGGGGQRYSENEGAWISVDSSHSSSSAPSIRAVGRVKSDASGVEVLAQQKIGQHKLDRADVLEVVLKLRETQVEVQGARPFQTSLALGPGECIKLSPGRWTSGAFVHGGVALC